MASVSVLQRRFFRSAEVGQGLPAGGVLGIDGIRQVVNERAQEQAFLWTARRCARHPLLQSRRADRRSAASACFRFVMSRAIPINPTILPASSLNGILVVNDQPISPDGGGWAGSFGNNLARPHQRLFVGQILRRQLWRNKIRVAPAQHLFRATGPQLLGAGCIQDDKPALGVFDEDKSGRLSMSVRRIRRSCKISTVRAGEASGPLMTFEDGWIHLAASCWEQDLLNQECPCRGSQTVRVFSGANEIIMVEIQCRLNS